MINRRDQDTLENWERWPLVFLFAANALNIFILYVPIDEMPEAIRWLLPWVKVLCGIAAALSLDGTIISVTMGRRLGRASVWSWATIVATGIFTAAVAWYVHRAVGLAAAVLFMAQAVILVLYGQHLAQPRKALQEREERLTGGGTRSGSRETAIVLAKTKSHDTVHTAIKPRTCRKCGAAGFDTLNDVNLHQRTECPKRNP